MIIAAAIIIFVSRDTEEGNQRKSTKEEKLANSRSWNRGQMRVVGWSPDKKANKGNSRRETKGGNQRKEANEDKPKKGD